MPAHSPIVRHVTDLDRVLVGPRRARADIVREVRDGLEDAAYAHRASGMTARESECAAVAEFGDVRAVAAEFQRELAVTRSRHALVFLACAGPVSEVTSRLLWSNAAPATMSQSPSPVALELARIVDVSAWLPSIAAAIFLVAMGFGERVWRFRSGFARWVGYGMVIKFVWVVSMGMVLSSMFGAGPSEFGLASVGVAVSWSLWGYALWLAWGCLRAARAGNRRLESSAGA